MQSVVLVWHGTEATKNIKMASLATIFYFANLTVQPTHWAFSPIHWVLILATVSLFRVMHCSLGQLFKHSTLVKFVIAPAKSLKHCFVLSLIVVLCSISIQSAPLKLWNHLEKPHRHCLNYHHSLFILSAQSGWAINFSRPSWLNINRNTNWSE